MMLIFQQKNAIFTREREKKNARQTSLRLQQILLNKRDGISAVRPETHWDFVASTSHLSNRHALVFPCIFLSSHNLKISFSSLIVCDCPRSSEDLL